MHPTISYYLAQARIADLRHHAQRGTLARAARRRRRRTRPLSRHQLSGRRASGATGMASAAHRDR